jgi:hypothetical protein
MDTCRSILVSKKISDLLARAHIELAPDSYAVTQRFAELIIDECAQALWTDECFTSDLAMEQFNDNRKKIKRHFEG